MIKTQLDQDIKTALLNGDTFRATVLRGLKSAILYVEVAEGLRETGLEDDKILGVFQKETKKRKESVDLYTKAGDMERADKEQQEIAIIEAYLPAQLDESAIKALVEEVISQTGPVTQQTMGQVIGAVKQKAGPTADGSIIARIVRERL